jgi:hypothetical protein
LIRSEGFCHGVGVGVLINFEIRKKKEALLGYVVGVVL